MTKWIEIPHGEFLVEVDDSDLWRAIKMDCLFHRLPWKERDAHETFPPLTPIEFYMIASTCPCPRHMDELAEAMGFTHEGYQEPPPLSL